MFKFFRRIRQNLIGENRFSKYLLYAIGEIILVVIGILIALQVNNWNEIRKRKNLEVKIYKELLQDLTKTMEEVESDRDNHIYYLHRVDSLLHHLVNQQPYNKKVLQGLFAAVGNLQVYPKTSGFENLKSIGLDILRNDTLRSQITDLYQLDLERVVKSGKMYSQVANIQDIMDPYLNRYLMIDLNNAYPKEVRVHKDSTTSYTRYGYTIRFYDELLDDTKFFSQLNRIQFIRQDLIERHTRTYHQIEKVFVAIKEEIQRIDPSTK